MLLSLVASTPDIATTGYTANLLLGTPAAVAAEARELGYDGIEVFPGPPGTIGAIELAQALRQSDVTLTAVNSGRIVAETEADCLWRSDGRIHVWYKAISHQRQVH